MKTVADLWDDFESKCLPSSMGEEMREEIGVAFHSGIGAILANLAEISAESRDPEEAAMALGELKQQAYDWLLTKALAQEAQPAKFIAPDQMEAVIADSPAVVRRLAERMGELGERAHTMIREAAEEDCGLIMVVFTSAGAMCSGNASSDEEAVEMMQASMGILHEAVQAHRINKITQDGPPTLH